MKRLPLLCIALAAAVLPLRAQRAGETPEQKAARMAWFDSAKLGIFIHWGIYAVDGVSESWSFYNKYLPYEQYMAQKAGFTAENYRPAGWAELIRESGARYTVITSKHHDGVALWDTKASGLSVPKQTPAGRDVLTPFVKEARQRGLKVGLYYSLLDWSHPDYPNFTKDETRYAIADDPARWQRSSTSTRPSSPSFPRHTSRTSSGSTATGSRAPRPGTRPRSSTSSFPTTRMSS